MFYEKGRKVAGTAEEFTKSAQNTWKEFQNLAQKNISLSSLAKLYGKNPMMVIAPTAGLAIWLASIAIGSRRHDKMENY